MKREELEKQNAAQVKKTQIKDYWIEYMLLREALQRLDVKSSAAWGREIRLPLERAKTAMRQLRMELEALEVGFDE